MAKYRMIVSTIRLSQSFAKLNYRQRDLWHGLIAVADDQGRLPGVATVVRSLVWPFDDIPIEVVEADLFRLEDIGLILRYEQDGSRYLQVVKWWVYQKMQWAGKSSYPPPDGWLDRFRYHGPGRKIITRNWDTPGGFCKQMGDEEVNDNDEVKVKVNDNARTQSCSTKVVHKGSDKGSQIDGDTTHTPTKFSRLSTFFVNLTSIPEFTGGAQRWIETIQKWIDAGVEEQDLKSAYRFLRDKDYSITGPWSLTNTAISEMSKRKNAKEAENFGFDEVYR